MNKLTTLIALITLPYLALAGPLGARALMAAVDPLFLPAALQQIVGRPRTTTLIPRPAGVVRIEADQQERTEAGVWVAEGKVVVTHLDMKLEADKIEYFAESDYAVATDNVILTRGAQRFAGSRAEYDIATGEGVFYDVKGKTDREYYLEAARITMTSRTTYRVQNGFITACQEAVPKWRFSSRAAAVNVESHATLRGAIFKVKKIPVLYLPFLRIPLEKKERSSGFLIPSTGTSTTKGRSISAGFYMTLGPSADALISSDYFSKRGLGSSLRFRFRPNDQTRLTFSSYLVADRIKTDLSKGTRSASGANISAQGETYLKHGFRGVIDLNLTSNNLFREVFAQDFRAATNTVDRSTIFLTNNFGAHSLNFLFARNESFLPAYRSLVVRNAPVVNFKTLGRQVSDWPLYFFLDTSLEGLNRLQHPDANTTVLTPEFVQRLDFHPRLLIPFRQFAGISLSAMLGARDTFYSHSFAENDTRTVTGQHINRGYVSAELTAKGPGLAKIYKDAAGESRFKHLIEPEIIYRRISGIDRFRRIIRFDEKEAIADSNEFEYALSNRILVKQAMPDGGSAVRELIYFRLGQKYFWDPTFGGALIEGQPNQFFPINTQTAFSYGGLRRRFSPISALLRWYTSWFYNAEARADYDPEARTLRAASLAGTATYRKLAVAAMYAYTKEIRIPDPSTSARTPTLTPDPLYCPPAFSNFKCDLGTFNSRQLQGQVGYGDPRKGFSTGGIFTYDLLKSPATTGSLPNKRHLLGSTTRLHYNWDCCGVTVEAQQYNLGFRSETLVRFSFTLGGVGSFGTIRKPQNLF
ncbi:MAG: LPS assembly protein LptD [Acidobacteria bacterium]|nr:LPS assembly protein LptD [Acidobacteriota bacterium]MBI3655259.1 LPS assembly protein LptD [Acidobacteriota bacterium]